MTVKSPRTTIVIAVKAKNSQLLECLEHCGRLTDQNFEIIVIPDMSCELPYPKTRVIASGPAGPSQKRDLGVTNARGEIIAFLDDDAYPAPEWLAAAIKVLSSPDVAAVGGPAITPPGDGLREQASGLVYSSWLAGGTYAYRYLPKPQREVDDYPTSNLLVKKQVFLEAGGFDTCYWPGEDTVLCLKITKELKKQIIYHPEVLVYHHRRPLFKGHLKQIISYALHRGFFAKKFPSTSLRWSYFLPSSLDAGILLGWLGALVWKPWLGIWLGGIGVYVGLAVTAGIRARPKRLALPVALGIIMTQVTYGIYFLKGFFAKQLQEENPQPNAPTPKTKPGETIGKTVVFLVFLVGQGLLLFTNYPLIGGLLCNFILLVVLLRRLVPFSKELLKNNLQAILILSIAIFAQNIIPHKPGTGMVFFIFAGLLMVMAPGKSKQKKDILSIPQEPVPRQAWEPWFFLILVIVGFVTRFCIINNWPLGAVGQEGMLIDCYVRDSFAGNYFPHFRDSSMPEPSLITYQGDFFAKIFGWSIESLRLAPEFWGLLSILVFYYVMRRLSSPITAAITSLLYMSSHLLLVLTRRFYPFTITLVAPLLSFGLLLVAIRKPHWISFLLAGMAAGFSLHGFEPGRGVILLFFMWMLWIWFFHRQASPAWRHVLVFWVGFLVVASPVVYFAITQPDCYWGYIASHCAPNRASTDNRLLLYISYLLEQVPAYAKMFHIAGDVDYAINFPKAPLLDPVMGVFFGVGIFYCIAKFWKPIPFFLLLYLAAGIVPAMLGSNYPHPTLRRTAMALPAIFLIGGLAIERLLQFLRGPGNRWITRIVIGLLLVAAGWSVVNEIRHYFYKWPQHPGTLSDFYQRGYLAGKEIARETEAKLYLQESFDTMHRHALFPKDREYVFVKSFEALLTMDPKRDHLLILEGYMQVTFPFFKKHFPESNSQAFAAENTDHPFCDTYYYHLYSCENIMPGIYFSRIFIPREDIIKFQSLVDVTTTPGSKPVGTFDAHYAQTYTGQKVKLAGALLSEDGGDYTIQFNWPGWEVKVDGRTMARNQTLRLTGGVHYLELEGKVPGDAKGALPLRILHKRENIVNLGQVVALLPEIGMKSHYLEWKEKKWEPGKLGQGEVWKTTPKVIRQEIFPIKRFYSGRGIELPFLVVFKGSFIVPAAGSYQFKSNDVSSCRLRVNHQVVFDNFPNRNRPLLHSIDLPAGGKAEFTAEYEVNGPWIIQRTFMLNYTGPGQSEYQAIPIEWYRFPR